VAWSGNPRTGLILHAGCKGLAELRERQDRALLDGLVRKLKATRGSPGRRGRFSRQFGSRRLWHNRHVRDRAARNEHLTDSVTDKIVNQRAVPEAHFGLGRVNIDIHFARIAIEEEQGEGETARRHEVVVSGG